MPNPGMLVIAIVGQKGGAGKTTLARAIASAALIAGRSVHLIDADPQGSLAEWFETIVGTPGGPRAEERISVEPLLDVDQIAAAIEQRYAAGNTDLILIDTKGELSQETAQLMMEADRIFLPVMARASDIRAQTRTLKLHAAMRAQDPENFPPLAAVVSCHPVKPQKAIQLALQTLRATFPLISTIVMQRAAYVTMDDEGLLHRLLENRRTSTDPLIRQQALPFAEALSEAIDVFNEVIGITHD